MTLSQVRLRLRKLINEQSRLSKIFMARKRLIKGGVYQSKSRCGKSNCKCVREGILHLVWRLYWTENGKTKLRALKYSELVYYQKLTRNYMRFRKARARSVKIHREMIELINVLEKGMTKGSVRGMSKGRGND
jgi:hypothetical protein